MGPRSRTFVSIVSFLCALGFAPALHAAFVAAEPPRLACCECRNNPCNQAAACGCSLSNSEGNLRDGYRGGMTINSNNGPTVYLALTYNTYNADGSRAQLNTVLGYGWTHSYNIFLFAQRGSMFRMDGEGRVTKYQLGANGTFTPSAGYFETLIRNSDNTFTLTTKDKTVHRFAQIPNATFLVEGPVWQLTSITDRNGNTTTLTYFNGALARITDTYGQSLALSYGSDNQLIAVTDPRGMSTRFTYDTNNTRLSQITDPNGRTTQYSYNTLNQITQKIDRDGRVFTHLYQSNKPVAVVDSAGNALFNLANPGNWATDNLARARDLVRVYLPATTTKTDGRGNAWRYEYDRNGYITQATAPDAALTRYSYDPATLQVASITDAKGNATRYQYDAVGNRTRKTDPRGFVTTYTYEPVFNQMTSMTDANGRVTTYQYDARGNRTQETDPLLQTRKWTYDANGNVLTDEDKRGNLTRYEYTNGNRTRATDAVGNVTMMSYDQAGNLVARTNPRGFTTTYEYDGLNRLIEETDALGKVTQTDYDGQGNRVRVIDRNDNSTDYRYDLRQRLVQTTDALGQVVRFAYDGNDNRTSATDKNNHTTTFAYDVQDRLVQTADAEGNVMAMSYDSVGNKLTETDANNHTTTYQYDALNRQVRRTDAVGNLTRMSYDQVGTPVCSECTGPARGSILATMLTDANGKVTYFTYDGLDRLARHIRKEGDTAFVIDPSDAVTRYTYDANNNRVSLIEPNGNATTFQYDALNRQARTANAAGDMTVTTYDPNSNVQTVTAPNLNVTRYSYDALDRLIRVDDAVGRVVSYTYDNVGNRLTETDGNGNGTTNTYDAIYRITDVLDALGRNTHYDYDPVGNLLVLTDREGNRTTYVYDDINRRIVMTDALNNVTRYEYDGVGNLTLIVDANNNATRYTYDGINRLSGETYADGRQRSFTYDGVNNLMTRTDQKGETTSYDYSDLYFLLRRDYPVSPDDNMTYDLSGRMLTAERSGWLVTFVYDGANRVTTTTQNGKTVRYAYDIPNRKRTLAHPGGRTIEETTDLRSQLGRIDRVPGVFPPPPPIVTYTYDLGNRVVRRDYANGTTATYSYNANNWIANLDHTRGVVRIAGFNQDFDREGNKRFEQKLHEPPDSEAYQYDKIYRLIDFKVGNLVGATVPLPTTQTQYDLDGVGNWKGKIVDGVTESRLHSVTNEITRIAAVPILSDPNGNTSEDERYRYSYDEENRLTTVIRKADAAVVGQYHYDALSRRIVKVANPAGVPVQTRYFYDDARIIEEQSAAGVTEATYVYGNYMDEVLTMDRGGQTFYYHQNALMSVAAISDSAATVVERYSYDAYGLPIITDGAGTLLPFNAWGTPHSAIGNPWMFTGRQFDEETGIYFYRARYYDPVKGRFLQRDPLGYVEGMNLYEYATSDPVQFVDPNGLTSVTTTFGAWRRVDANLSSTPGMLYESVRMLMVAITAEFDCSDQGNVQVSKKPTVSHRETSESILTHKVSKPALSPENCGNGTEGRRVALGITAQRHPFKPRQPFARKKLANAVIAISFEHFIISGEVEYRVCCRCASGAPARGITVEDISGKPQSNSWRMAVGISQDEPVLGVTKSAWITSVHMRPQNVSFEQERAWQKDFPIADHLRGETRKVIGP